MQPRRGDRGALLDRWRTAIARRDAAAARELLRQADAQALPAMTWVNLATGRFQAGAQAEAVQLLQAAQRQYPGDFWVNHDLGQRLQEMVPPRRADAIRYYSVAAALLPASPAVHLNLGVALKQQGRYDEAIAEYRQVLALKPNYPAANNNLGNALADQGRPAEAAAANRRALEVQPDLAGAHYGLGLVLRDLGDLAGSLDALRRGHDLRAQAPDWPYPSARRAQKKTRRPLTGFAVVRTM